MSQRSAACGLLLALAGCGGDIEPLTAVRPCAEGVCGQAIRVEGDPELHRIEPAHGRATVCGIELDRADRVVDGHDAEDELRAGGGHHRCWRRPKN